LTPARLRVKLTLVTPENLPLAPAAPPAMSEVSRLGGVLFEPGKTFQDVGERPRWLVPLLLVILSAVVYNYCFGQHVGWDRFFRQQLETNRTLQRQMSNMAPEQRERTIQMQARFANIGYTAGAVVLTPLMFLIIAGVLMGITSILSAGLRFKVIFAIVCYASLPGVIKQILATVVMFLKNPDDFNYANPLVFNLAAFLDPLATSKFLYTLASAVDVFVIWGVVLLAIGLSAASKRLSFGSALAAVAVPWIGLVLIGASVAGIFS
jgi:hypothetical protein